MPSAFLFATVVARGEMLGHKFRAESRDGVGIGKNRECIVRHV